MPDMPLRKDLVNATQYPRRAATYSRWLWKLLPARLHSERDFLFFSFTLLLGLGYLVFSLTSWRVGFDQGVPGNLFAALAMASLAIFRWKGCPRHPLLSWMQALTLLQATWSTWLTGGIYSPALGWVALAPLPALLIDNRRCHLLGLLASGLAILGLYLHALSGAELQLDLPHEQLVHWHMVTTLVIFGIQLAMLQRLHSVQQERWQQVRTRARAQRQLCAELQSVQQQKDLLIASISHELRTPMNAILGLADLIQHQHPLNDALRAKIQNIQKSGEHLLTIVNDLLDHAQLEAGRLHVVCEAFDLHDALHRSHQLLRPCAESKPIRYELHIASDLPQWVMGDARRLVQVLVNLLGNAIKFTPQEDITLDCNCSKDCVWIEVRDTGIGIPSRHLDRIFEHFEQVHASHPGRFGGNGLGLSITRGLVKAMGGEIRVESQEGQGTRFFIWLPLKIASPPSQSKGPLSITDLQNPCFLVADDKPLNRQIAAMQLRRQWPQARILEANTGVEVLKLLSDHAVDAVLMDLLMPEMDGIQATRRIREELPEPKRHVPVVGLTANADRSAWERCQQVGMNNCLLKPFDRLQLIRTLQDLLAQTTNSRSPAPPVRQP